MIKIIGTLVLISSIILYYFVKYNPYEKTCYYNKYGICELNKYPEQCVCLYYTNKEQFEEYKEYDECC